MEILTLLAISIALAMDAFAVSIAIGICLKKITVDSVVRVSTYFGLFQALMPVIGWGIGVYLYTFIQAYAPWVAFFLLVGVGGHMLKEAFSKEMKEACQIKDPTRGGKLLLLAIATSIDALAVGFSLTLMETHIFIMCVMIGLTAAGFTVLGLYIGKKVRETVVVREVAEVFGGVVLMGIGGKILVEHHALDGVLDILKPIWGI